MTSTIKYFRFLAVAEGVLFLILIFAAIPLKYFFDQPKVVNVLGPIHGVVFFFYIIFNLIIQKKLNWSSSKTLTSILSGIIPFGTFYIIKNYLP